MSSVRRSALLRFLGELRSPDEGLLPNESYATLLESFMATRERTGRGFLEDEFYAVVEWADLAALRSQWIEGILAGTMGLDLVDGDPALCAPPTPAARAEAAASVPEPADGDLSRHAVLVAFVAGRRAGGQPFDARDLGVVRDWAAAAAADRALLDLALGYEALGLDLLPDGRVTLIGAGRPL